MNVIADGQKLEAIFRIEQDELLGERVLPDSCLGGLPAFSGLHSGGDRAGCYAARWSALA